MSDINIDFTVANIDANFTVATNELSFTPTDIQLTLYTGGFVDTATAVNANIANVHISGGTNGYVLQTDGAGNLTWTAQTGGGGGNGSPGGANTQIQYNDSGAFGGNVGFTFNEITGNVAIPGNLAVVGNITGSIANANYSNYSNVANSANYAGNITVASQPNVTSVGTLTGVSVAGTTTIQQAIEKVSIQASAAGGNINIDMLNQAVYYYTANSTSNFTFKVRGNSTTTLDSIMSVGQSMTFSVAITNGSPGYYANVFYIDSFIFSPKYIGGTPTNGTNNGIDVYTYNMIKTGGNTWTVLGSKIGYT